MCYLILLTNFFLNQTNVFPGSRQTEIRLVNGGSGLVSVFIEVKKIDFVFFGCISLLIFGLFPNPSPRGEGNHGILSGIDEQGNSVNEVRKIDFLLFG